MIRLLSYIFPFTRTIKSDYSGTLEITWFNGKKHLNTKNANYSYGSLQKILKFGLQKIDLNNCNKILVLGLGGGSVIKTLLNDFNYTGHITALDIDPVIIEIAKNEFKISESGKLKIICEDAINFMNNNKKLFDLIIIDLFIDSEVPTPIFKTSFWEQIIKSNSIEGKILFNASLNSHDNKNLIAIKSLLSKNKYHIVQFNKVEGTNTLLIACRINSL